MEDKDRLFLEKWIQMTGNTDVEKQTQILSGIRKIRELKKQHNAIVLSHYYMPAELQITAASGGVSDCTGDSLALSLFAANSKATSIVFCGVEFMAETAAILCEEKRIFIPDKSAGCSLAAGINAEDVMNLKRKHPGVPVMAYINTNSATKAVCDVICTSRNAVRIADSLPGDEIIFVPDLHMGKNLAAKSKKKFILWNGSCEVHEQFRENLTQMAVDTPDAEILLHLEVPEQTVRLALHENQGIAGSTSDIIQRAGKSDKNTFIVASECDLVSTLKGQFPEKNFIGPCIYCPYMKKINLKNTLETLQSIGTKKEAQYRIDVDMETKNQAKKSLDQMLKFS